MRRFLPWAPARLLPVVLLAAGCAGSTTVTRDPGTVSIITGEGSATEVRLGPDVLADQGLEATPAQAWDVLPDVFAQLELVPDIRNPSARALGVSEHRFSRRILGRSASDFFDCGLDPGLNRPIADQVPITASVVTTVLASAGAASLRTVVQGTARRTGGNAGIATCRTTGLMEALLAEMVRARVAPGEAPGR